MKSISSYKKMLKREKLRSYDYIDGDDFRTLAIFCAQEVELANLVSHKNDKIFKRLMQKCKEEGTLEDVLTYKTFSKGMTLLHMIASRGTSEMLRIFLLEKPDINVVSVSKSTPLHVLIKENNFEALETLLFYRPDVNIRDKDGKTPLHYIVEKNNPLLLKRFLQAVKKNKLELDVNIQDAKGKTPLHLAAEGDKIENVLILLREGAQTNLVDQKEMTPVRSALVRQKINFVKVMMPYLSSQEEVNEQDEKRGWTLLMEAGGRVCEDIFMLLLQHPKINLSLKDKHGKTLLHHLAAGGMPEHLEMMKAVLEHEEVYPQLSVRDNAECTPLDYCHDKKMKQLLQSYGAERNRLEKKEENLALKGKNELHFAVLSKRTQQLEEMVSRASEEAVNKKDAKGKTPLDYAVQIAIASGDTRVLKVLLAQEKVKISSKSYTADDLYALGFYCNDKKLIRLLVQERALPLTGKRKKFFIRRNEIYPFHRMLTFEDSSLIDAFMKLKHDDSVFVKKNDVGDYPLHIVVQKGNYNWVKKVLEKAPNILNEKGRWGDRPLSLAFDRKELEPRIIKMFLRQPELDIFALDLDQRNYRQVAQICNMPEDIIMAIQSRMEGRNISEIPYLAELREIPPQVPQAKQENQAKESCASQELSSQVPQAKQEDQAKESCASQESSSQVPQEEKSHLNLKRVGSQPLRRFMKNTPENEGNK